MFKYPYLILERHLDTLGHVNHAVYFEIFEEARWQWIHSRGYGLEVLMKNKIAPIILEANAKFKKELRLRDKIIIESEVTEMKQLTQYVEQRMVKENGDISCVGTFTLALFDLNARKLIPPTDEWKKVLSPETY